MLSATYFINPDEYIIGNVSTACISFKIAEVHYDCYLTPWLCSALTMNHYPNEWSICTPSVICNSASSDNGLAASYGSKFHFYSMFNKFSGKNGLVSNSIIFMSLLLIS